MARLQRKRQRRRDVAIVDEPGLSEREARLARMMEARRAKARRARMRRIRNVTLTVVAVLAVGAGLFLGFRPDPELAGVERPASEGGGHVVKASYDSAVPTSGPHDARAPVCGVYRGGLEPELAVHALEHGAVVLWYDSGRPQLAEDLSAATSEFESHVIIAANDALDVPIVATAWNRRSSYEPTNPEITEFVRTYRERGPERLACDL